MLRNRLHIILSLFLVFTTTTSIWGNLLAHEDDPIEVKTEKEADSEETGKEKELDDLEDDLIHSSANQTCYFAFLDGFVNSLCSELQAKPAEKLYLLYHHLKIAC